jgi:transposase
MWDGTGLCIYQKRLEQGRFASLWAGEGGGNVELTQSELALFLEGSKYVGKMSLSPKKYVVHAIDK